MAHIIQGLMDHYGYYVLGIALMLELLALPLPGEVLMTYTGLLIFQGHLNWMFSIVIAGCGASLGMSLSYWIGFKLGTPFFEKHGAKIHFGPDKLQKTSDWFERYGNKLLIIAYFIPGIRHFTGYFSGVTRMPFRTYMLYAYPGAFLWTGTFISLGKILGPKWEQFHHTITKYLLMAGVIAALLFVVIYLFKRYREQIYSSTAKRVSEGVKIFHSFGKVRFLLLASFGVFLTLFILMAGLVQDFLANEFADFDDVTTYIILILFEDQSVWNPWMTDFAYLSSIPVLLTITGLTMVWILFKSHDRFLEIGFMLFVLVGGELWDEGLRRLFHRTGPENLVGTFPSEQTLITLIFLGFAMFLLVRHLEVTWVRTGVVFLVLAVSFLVGLSRIYFNIQYPSDVVAGYVFGGVWLSLNVILLEIFRLIQGGKNMRGSGII